jgi:hypothetical protein
MKRAMISQPMRGLSEEEIRINREAVVKELEEAGWTVVDTIFPEFDIRDIKNKSLTYLAKSIEIMSTCDGVYFMKGWTEARGCIIEHMCCEQYGIKIIVD